MVIVCPGKEKKRKGWVHYSLYALVCNLMQGEKVSLVHFKTLDHLVTFRLVQLNSYRVNTKYLCLRCFEPFMHKLSEVFKYNYLLYHQKIITF